MPSPGERLIYSIDDVLEALRKRDAIWKGVVHKTEELVRTLPRALRKRYWMGFTTGAIFTFAAARMLL